MNLSQEDIGAIYWFLVALGGLSVFAVFMTAFLSIRATGALVMVMAAWAASAIMSAWGAWSLMSLDVSVVPIVLISALATAIAATLFWTISRSGFWIRLLCIPFYLAIALLMVTLNTTLVAQGIERGQIDKGRAEAAETLRLSVPQQIVDATDAKTQAQTRLAEANAAIVEQGRVVAAECASGDGPKCKAQTRVLQGLERSRDAQQTAIDTAQATIERLQGFKDDVGEGETQTRRAVAQRSIDQYLIDEVGGYGIRIILAIAIGAMIEFGATVVPAMVFGLILSDRGGWLSPWMRGRAAYQVMRAARKSQREAEAKVAEIDQIVAAAEQRVRDAEAGNKQPELDAALAAAEKARGAAERARDELAQFDRATDVQAILNAVANASEFDLRDALDSVDVDGEKTEAAVLALVAGEQIDSEDQVRIRKVYNILNAA